MLSEAKLKKSMTLVLFLLSSLGLSDGQVSREFRRTFKISLAEPVNLQADVLEGDLHIAYARDGEVSISVAAENASGLDLESLLTRLVMAQSGNHLEVREQSGPASQNFKVTYTIAVPYRTALHASLRRGKQTIAGIMGAVNAEVGIGDIEVSYISLGVTATARTGNLNFAAVGGRIEARTGQGKIVCQRAPQGISAEAEEGDIWLAVVGASTAVVKSGSGRIDVSGTHGRLLASTNAGDLHVKAIPHDEWKLSSRSGTIRLELPSAASFDLDADTISGQLTLLREDLTKTVTGARHFNQKMNGGGKRVEVRSNTGQIVIE